MTSPIRNRRAAFLLVALFLTVAGTRSVGAQTRAQGQATFGNEEHPALLEARKAVRLRDFEGAVRIWRKAANQGLPRAQYRLGAAYRSGRGVEADIGKAVFWFEKAARGGDAEAQYALGLCYQNGLGVEVDRAEALQWIGLAARGDHVAAKKALARMQKPGSLGFESAHSRVAVHRGDPRDALNQSIRVGDLGAAREALARGAPVNGAPGDEEHWRPLILAIESERPELVDLLIEYKADPNQRSRIGEPALVLAIRKGDRKVVRALLTAGASPGVSATNGYTPLMEAARGGNGGIVEDLLSARADPKVALADGTSAAEVARRFGFEALAARLKKAGAPTLDGRSAAIRTAGARRAASSGAGRSAAMLPPVVEAARRGDADLLAELAAEGVALDVRDPEGDLAIHRAADGGHAKALRVLLERGLDVNARGRQGTTALQRAMASTAEGSEVLVAMLLERGADPNLADDNGASLVAYAAEGGTLGKIEKLRAAEFRFDEQQATDALVEATLEGHLPAARGLLEVVTQQAGRAAALCAAIGGHRKEIFDLLLEVGVRPKQAVCAAGEGPLRIAAHAGDEELVVRLLAAGAVADESSKDGDTPLIAAASRGHDAIVRRLLEAGADFDHRGAHRMTALMGAASNGHADVVDRLLAAGADRKMRSRTGQRAADLARAAGQTQVAKRIDEYRPGWAGWLGGGGSEAK